MAVGLAVMANTAWRITALGTSIWDSQLPLAWVAVCRPVGSFSEKEEVDKTSELRSFSLTLRKNVRVEVE